MWSRCIKRGHFIKKWRHTCTVQKGHAQAECSLWEMHAPKCTLHTYPLHKAHCGMLQYCSFVQIFPGRKTQMNRARECCCVVDYVGQGHWGHSLPQQTRKVLKKQFIKLCSCYPECLFLQLLWALCPTALLRCICDEAFQSVSLSVMTTTLNYYYLHSVFSFSFFPFECHAFSS